MHLRRFILLATTLAAALVPATAAQAFPTPNSWTQLGGLNESTGEWVREYASAIASPNTIYAATEGDGIYKSTNGGISFSAFNGGLNASHGDFNVRAIIAGSTTLAGTEGGLFKSTGGSWTPLAQGDEADPANPKKLNRSVQSLLPGKTGQLLAGTFAGGVYKSTDDGATWTPPSPSNGMPPGETVWSLSTLTEFLIYAATSSGLYASVDFGSTWTPVGDGVTGTTFRVFVDGDNPNIVYAGTSDGFFRSITAGLTWTKEDGPPGHTIGNGPVRSIQQFTGVNETRIYATTNQGLYVGTAGNNDSGGFLPGPISWRKIIPNDAGLNFHNEFWNVSSFIGPIAAGATMIVGSHGGGGYGLTITPPANTVAPAITPAAPYEVGDTVTTSDGTWTGTKTIEFEYQWQDCGTSNNANNCQDISGATEKTLALPDSLNTSGNGHWFRSIVTAKNDFPSLPAGPSPYTASSALKGPVSAAANTVPGYSAHSAPSIKVINDDPNISFPMPGTTLHAQNWNVQPCATHAENPNFPVGSLDCSYKFSWISCLYGSGGVTENDPSCEPARDAQGALRSGLDILLGPLDVGHSFCVKVTGFNANGAATTTCSGFTNNTFPLAPAVVKAPFVDGSVAVGVPLTGNAGLWKPAPVSYKRQWEQCAADGSSCSYISGASGSSYTPKADDIGHTLRVIVTVDSNGPNTFPGPSEATSAPSGVVPNLDGSPATPVPPGGITPPPPPPPADLIAPSFTSVKASSSVKSGKPLGILIGLSEPSLVKVTLQSVKNGRKKGKTCKAGARKGKKCKAYKTLSTKTLPVTNGKLSLSTKLKGKKLRRGKYRVLLTPIDASGNAGARKTLNFRIT